MTSITQLLSPIPITKHSLVLRDQMDQSTSSTSAYSSAEAMQTDNMSPPEHDHSDHLGHDLEGSGDGSGDGRKGYGKRELSTSKRAAQNRAAQVSAIHHILNHQLLMMFSSELSVKEKKDISRNLKNKYETIKS
jgi:hypothetical protein